jgi:hypothetical protein
MAQAMSLVSRRNAAVWRGQTHTGLRASSARPNPSVKRSAASRPPSPRAAVVYPASPGLGVLPPPPAYLER